MLVFNTLKAPFVFSFAFAMIRNFFRTKFILTAQTEEFQCISPHYFAKHPPFSIFLRIFVGV